MLMSTKSDPKSSSRAIIEKQAEMKCLELKLNIQHRHCYNMNSPHSKLYANAKYIFLR